MGRKAPPILTTVVLVFCSSPVAAALPGALGVGRGFAAALGVESFCRTEVISFKYELSLTYFANSPCDLSVCLRSFEFRLLARFRVLKIDMPRDRTRELRHFNKESMAVVKLNIILARL